MPPINYGGSERVIYDLTEKLIEFGHEVYLFCNKNSNSNANMIFYPDDIKEWEINDFVRENLPDGIDVIHDNTEFIIFNKEYYNMYNKIPVLFTLHYASKDHYEYNNTIYPSNYIKFKLNGKNYNNVVYHGLNPKNYLFEEEKSDYMLFLGMVKYNKGTHIAIEIAKRLNKKLIIAGPQDVDDSELVYFNNYIKPNLNEYIEYIGEVGGYQKLELISKAEVLIFPTIIETFGLVAIESMFSGTPVLMLKECTSSEIIPRECISSNIEEMIDIIDNKRYPTSKYLYDFCNSRFNDEIMTTKYINSYKNIIKNGELIMEKEKKQTISLCMIVKNEENRIGNCLSSVFDIVDEIIIVDTGSTDNTKEVCRKFTDKVYDFEWVYDFSKARNEALKYATGDYIFFLDSDDVLKEEDRIKFKKLKDEMDGSVDLYWMYYDYRHDEDGNSICSFLSERIFRNHNDIKWSCVVHEVLNVKKLYANSVKTDIRITHTSNHDNTLRYLEYFKINEEKGIEFNPREKYFYATELYKNSDLDKCEKLLQSIIDGTKEGLNGYELYSTHYMLGSIQKTKMNFSDAVINFLVCTGYHQPMLEAYYDIAECYQYLGMIRHAKFYFESIANDLFFKEEFSNESVYSDFQAKRKSYMIKSLLSLLVIEYNYNKNIEKSREYNDMVLELDPTNESALYNKNFFNSLDSIGGI